MSDRLSRGEIISLLVGVPLAAAATTAAASAAADNKKQFKYQDKPGKNGEKCAQCRFFKAPNRCSIVTGNISPNGWCIAWAKK